MIAGSDVGTTASTLDDTESQRVSGVWWADSCTRTHTSSNEKLIVSPKRTDQQIWERELRALVSAMDAKLDRLLDRSSTAACSTACSAACGTTCSTAVSSQAASPTAAPGSRRASIGAASIVDKPTESRWRSEVHIAGTSAPSSARQPCHTPLPAGDGLPEVSGEEEERRRPVPRIRGDGTVSVSTRKTMTLSFGHMDHEDTGHTTPVRTSILRSRPSRISIFSSLTPSTANWRESAGLPEPSAFMGATPSMMRAGTNGAWKKQLSSVRISDFSSRGRPLSSFAESLHLFLEDSDSSMAALWYSRIMPVLVAGSVFTSLAQLVEGTFLTGVNAAVLETIFDVVFLVEVMLRLAVCPAPLMFCLGPLNLIDLLSVAALPLRVYMGFVFPPEVHVDKSITTVVLLGFLPVVRSLKLLRRWQKVHLLTQAFADVFEALPVLLFPLTIIIMFFACLIFLVEPSDNIGSVWAAFWLTIVTMTTVGYGDAIPQSSAGSIIVGVLVMFSVLYMAMPIGIVGQAFTLVWQDRQKILLLHTVRNRLANWGYTCEDAAVLFDAFAVRRKGVITDLEFRIMVRKLKLGLSEDRTTELFRLFDGNSNGSISEKEFVKALFPEKLKGYDGEEEPATPPTSSQGTGSK